MERWKQKESIDLSPEILKYFMKSAMMFCFTTYSNLDQNIVKMKLDPRIADVRKEITNPNIAPEAPTAGALQNQ